VPPHFTAVRQRPHSCWAARGCQAVVAVPATVARDPSRGPRFSCAVRSTPRRSGPRSVPQSPESAVPSASADRSSPRADQRMSSAASWRDSPATSVGHASASIPVALRITRASRCTSASDICSRRGASASSNHLIARPWRNGSCVRSTGSASSERRSIVRCCDSVSTIMRVNASTTRSSRVATSSGASSGSRDEAPVSGWAATSSERWLGKYR
jgi:hypothetical protein